MKRFLGLCLAVVTTLCSFKTKAQGTFYTAGEYNVCVYTPSSYNSNPTKKYPVIVFMPGAGEIGTNKDALVRFGPSAYVKQMGTSTFGGVEFIVASFQQKAQYSRPWTDKVFFDFLYANFRVDTENIFGTGLSRGWWHTGHYATYQKTATDMTYIKTYKGLCIYEGQPCDDTWDATLKYPAKFGHWAKLNDGYLLGVQNYNSAFYCDQVVKAVNDSLPNHAWFFKPTYAGGGHTGWDYHYGGNGRTPGKYNVNGTQMDMYQFFAWIVKKSIPQVPAPVITSPTSGQIFIAKVGTPIVPISFSGTGHTSFEVKTNAPGLTVSTNGTISGTPTAVGQFASTVKLTNATGSTGAMFYINVESAPKQIARVQSIIDYENPNCSIKITYYSDGTFTTEKL